ncbi:MAG: hypothetical protein SGJ18_00120 [Pseudomonadota bacterium]|nr:hypothetical protein [Pseudomonadota bacterium]
MARYRLYHEDLHYVRKCLRQSHETAKQMQELTRVLVEQLEDIERKRLYTRLGFKSLRGYCQFGLGFNRRQSQSLETALRSYQIAVNFGQ